MRAVVPVIEPLSAHAQTVALRVLDHADVVEVRLRDREGTTTGALRGLRHTVRDLLEDVAGAGVLERVHGVDPEAVDVEVLLPNAHIVEDVIAHPVGAEVIQVDLLAPRGGTGGEDLEELGQVVPGWAQVVVDDVQHDGQVALVAGIHEALQADRPAVLLLGRVPGHAVVAPVARAVEPVDGQDLDGVDAQLGERIQVLDRGLEGALRGEGADVHLVEHGVLEIGPAPVVVGPLEVGGVVGA